MSLTWEAFEAARPDLAAVGRALFYNFGIGLGFLATVRPDGGPRVHPISVIVTGRGLYGFILPGPKLNDLRRDGRYALHSETIPPPRQDDGFYVTGRAIEISDANVRELVAAQFLVELGREGPWPGFEVQGLFEFQIERCLVTLTSDGHGLPKGHSVWRAP